MPVDLNNEHWFALQTKPNCEQAVVAHLQVANITHFFPTYQIKRQRFSREVLLSAPLFPGYVFTHISWTGGPRLYKIPGIVRVVGTNKTPMPIDDSEIDGIRRVVSQSADVSPWVYPQPGQQVHLTNGPLRGISGVYVNDKGKGKMVVSVDMLCRSIAIVVRHDWLSVDNPRNMSARAGECPARYCNV